MFEPNPLPQGEKVNVVIGPYIKHSIANRPIERWKAFAEFIDNSTAARSHLVDITIEPSDFIRIRDFGCGMMDIRAAFEHGKSDMKDDAGGINTFGVGLKDGAAGLGYILEIASIRDGVIEHGWCDWRDFSFNGYHRLPSMKAMDGERGTIVTIRQLKKPYAQVSQLKAKLEKIYRPLLLSGRTAIRINGDDLVPNKLGPEIDTTFRLIDVDSERSIECAGGLYEIESDYQRAFVFVYKGRVLFETNQFCGDYGASNNFYVELALRDRVDNGWKFHLSPDKCGFAEELPHEVNFAIYEAFLGILKKCASERQRYMTGLVSSKLDCISRRLGRKKIKIKDDSGPDDRVTGAARPGPKGVRPGTVKPTGKGSEHRRTKNPKGDGKYRDKTGDHESGIHITWKAGEATSPLVLSLEIARSPVDNAKTCSITFNESHPWVDAPNGKKKWQDDSYADEIANQVISALAAQQSTMEWGDYRRIVQTSGEVASSFDAYKQIHSELMREKAKHESKSRRRN